MPNNDLVKLSVYIPAKDYAQIQRWAKRDFTTPAFEMRNAVREYVMRRKLKVIKNLPEVEG